MIIKRFAAISILIWLFAACSCSGVRYTATSLADIAILQKPVSDPSGIPVNEGQVADTLSLNEAVSLALQHNPVLSIYKAEIMAQEAIALQQSLLPNPDLDIELENFSGSGPFSALAGSETTIAIGQLIELGGKRGKRTKIAELASDLALWRYEMKRLDIITQVREFFILTLAGQEKIKVDSEILEISRKFKSNVEKKVTAGRLSPAELARARVELANADLALRKSGREFNNMKRQLASTWAARETVFDVVIGDLDNYQAIPDAEFLSGILEMSPQIIEQKVLMKKNQVHTELASAKAIPDPRISAGFRYFKETDDQAFVAGLSIPLPIFDRNQGAIEATKLHEEQGAQELQKLRIRLDTECGIRLETIRNVAEEIAIMQDRILPEAQKAYDITFQNYQMGKFSLIDVLDAQRQLFNTERRYIDALTEINIQIIKLEGLIGQPIQTLM